MRRIRQARFVAQDRPQLLANVRGKRGQDAQKRLDPRPRHLLCLGGLVGEHHHLGNRGVEAQAGDRLADLLDGRVQRSLEVACLPDRIPEEIVFDEITTGDTLRDVCVTVSANAPVHSRNPVNRSVPV